MSINVSPICVTPQQTKSPQSTTSKMDAMFERYDHLFTEEEKNMMNNVSDAVVDTVKGKGYSDKQINTLMNKIMTAFETLPLKEQEQYVDAAIRFLTNA